MAKKSFKAAALSLVLALLLAAPALAAQIGIVVDGQEIDADPAPRMVNSRVLVPLRLVSESLNAGVTYSPSDGGEITINTRDDDTIVLKIGSKTAIKTSSSGQQTKLKLDSPAKIYNEYTFVPLRFVAEALGAKVDWQAAKQQVIITPAEFKDPDPAYVNSEGKALHSMTRHWFMTIGGHLEGYWGHKQVGQAWELLVEGRGREIAKPEQVFDYNNMDPTYYYGLDYVYGFYTGEPKYSEGADEQADYLFTTYRFTVNYDDGTIKRPAAEDGQYLVHDENTDKWYILPASKYEALQKLQFPVMKLLVNNVA